MGQVSELAWPVAFLKISIHAAEEETHQRLRLGSKWEVMQENMRFAGELKERGLIEELELVFTVQQDNYQEVGDACDWLGAWQLRSTLIALRTGVLSPPRST